MEIYISATVVTAALAALTYYVYQLVEAQRERMLYIRWINRTKPSDILSNVGLVVMLLAMLALVVMRIREENL